MAQIDRYPLLSWLRSDAASYIQVYRKGARVRAGRGLSFWLRPDAVSVSEIPLDDRQLSFVTKGKSADFQDLTLQGSVVWRVVDPQVLGDRIDFTIDLKEGRLAGDPMQQINDFLFALVRQFALAYLQGAGVRDLLAAGVAPLQDVLAQAFNSGDTLSVMGLQVIGVSLSGLSPTSELERALQAPTLERIQQQADEATFARRALAVEKERAIAENELNTKIELATRQQALIERDAANDRAEAESSADTRRLEAQADAEICTIRADAEARSITAIEQAKADAERVRMEVLTTVPPSVLLALAAQEFAGKVQSIDNLTITPDMLSGLLSQVSGLFAGPAALGRE